MLDIGLKEGNARNSVVSGGLGLIGSRLTVEAPLVEDTASFIISGRRTYIDVLAKPFVNPESAFAGSGYYFYDLNAKVNWRASRKNQFYLGYFGRDVFNFRSNSADFSSRIPWGNATVTGRWNHVISDKAFLTTTATYSDYEFAFESQQDSLIFGFRSGIDDRGSRRGSFSIPTPGTPFGPVWSTPTIPSCPRSSMPAATGSTLTSGSRADKSHEIGVYVEDEFDVTEALRINAGLRHNGFIQTGLAATFILQRTTRSPPPRHRSQIRYSPGEVVAKYGRIRTSPLPALDDRAKKLHQGGHRAESPIHPPGFLSPTSLPGDIWLPSSDRVRPQEGTQVSAGWFRDFGADRNIEFSLEAYHKWLDNLVAYAEGTSPQDNIADNVDNNLVAGTGTSYGTELFLKRKRGEMDRLAGPHVEQDRPTIRRTQWWRTLCGPAR